MNIAAIMPTYNQERWLPHAVNSISHQVEQLIVVNDGDHSPVVHALADINRPTNGGTAAAINEGWRKLQKNIDWVTWVSSDNEALPNWRALMEEGARKSDKVGVVYTAYIRKPPGSIFFQDHKPEALIQNVNCYYGPSFVIRRDVWERAGGHRGRISHDYDHWLRVEEACWDLGLEIVGLPDPGVVYNVHDERVTVTRAHEFDADKWQREARERRDACATN